MLAKPIGTAAQWAKEEARLSQLEKLLERGSQEIALAYSLEKTIDSEEDVFILLCRDREAMVMCYKAAKKIREHYKRTGEPMDSENSWILLPSAHMQKMIALFQTHGVSASTAKALTDYIVEQSKIKRWARPLPLTIDQRLTRYTIEKGLSV